MKASVTLPPVITIDGASGTGKGVVTHQLAKQLGWKFLDSGVLYRVLAFAAQKHDVSLDNAIELVAQAQVLDVRFIPKELGVPPQIIVEGEDVTETIRTEAIGNAASKIGTIAVVREALLDRQRAFREFPGLVADGRDMGTVVFPDAQLKIFLLATPEERAQRRYNQLKGKGINVNLGSLIEELRERDKRDHERTVAPLKPADDALCIETDHLSIDQVVAQIMQEVSRIFPSINEIEE